MLYFRDVEKKFKNKYYYCWFSSVGGVSDRAVNLGVDHEEKPNAYDIDRGSCIMDIKSEIPSLQLT